jgi:mono/diheme cytochrome c family protein
MTTSRRRWPTIVTTLVLSGVIGHGAQAGDGTAEGRVLYVHHCASCHGVAADGRGPVAPVLTPPPRDLRTLRQRYGNPLPVDRIAQLVDGREIVTAHGPRTMPVWGDRLGEGGAARVRGRIEAIVAWLATVQAN